MSNENLALSSVNVDSNDLLGYIHAAAGEEHDFAGAMGRLERQEQGYLAETLNLFCAGYRYHARSDQHQAKPKMTVVMKEPGTYRKLCGDKPQLLWGIATDLCDPDLPEDVKTHFAGVSARYYYPGDAVDTQELYYEYGDTLYYLADPMVIGQQSSCRAVVAEFMAEMALRIAKGLNRPMATCKSELQSDYLQLLSGNSLHNE